MNFFQTGYKGRNDWWMYIVMFFVIFFTSILGQLPITFLALSKVGGDMQLFTESGQNNFADLGIDSNLYLFLILLSFIVPLIFFILILKGMHKKKFSWVVTSREKIDWKRVWYGVAIWGIVTIGFIGIDIFLAPENYVWNFKPIPFFTLCLVSILFIPLQTTLEEVLFRGYYMQGLALWLKNRWAPLIIMSVVFGVLHIFNPEIDKLGYTILVFYIGTGFFFGITTLLDEGAELAIGMHAVNNVLAALFVTTDWTVFQTDALYVDISEPTLGIEMLLPVFVLYPIVLFIFTKKYGWTNWKDKLFGKVEEPVNSAVIDELGS
ncbi:CPBP family intramembrane glutamic endopeptidase [Pseudotenacibaculum sp. MALMAid0570]|uniref:CPBP family intramembrane glutamic endopeptidase n=1 Tax=Pseudotenacibaculum sp. MALMAid0570 TaxID=3143938 RepID=UPI0032DE878E